jgi:class 3 adenylate cyclase/tetratricopeptide (TPR) repeat protein
MRCPACQSENEVGRKFCGECGTPLAQACPTCGTANPPTVKFCGECGTALTTAAPTPAPVVAVAPAAERRLVSVLFADLVGFTTASEGRDAEETRELLSRYFETARTLIERYGGTVEKFIGDAVMAVWGTPTAREDDAERSVRAALDLVAAVPDLDRNLQARAGVLTGEAAVTLGAAGEGMVAGDLVNTASRIQSAAEPGTVLVGEATKRASEAAVSYEDAGEHPLKGKAEPARLWRALRVGALRGGLMKFEGLEPPFVGRDRELRLIKELLHASAEDGKAHLVSVTGIGGLGKSRLVWEFHKYIDGLVEDFFWWRGRCLAYGEGVAYWALAEMVRIRADIVEGEEPESARAKLKAGVAEFITDPDEQAWIEPRLAHLLGLEERMAVDREDLFAAWRLYFERLSENRPAILVFEDTHWADPSLLEFVDYLLEWSRNHPIFVLSVARPELMERHPTWGAGSRSYTAIALEPLSNAAVEKLLEGLVPGLPDDLRASILARAEGVPLYAVETVRMLLDRGLIAREGDSYRLTGQVEALEVPETLHALVAARLDGLEPEQRRLLQDASVLGKTFTKEALSALTGLPEKDLEPLLTALVRKEVLSIQADPRSPERGQYGFLQDLLRFVAYETLAKKERKARHLAAAEYLEREWGPAEHEIVEVLASHYVDAYRAAPDAPDASSIKTKAQEALARAGERAASLAASEEAERYFEQAADLTNDPAAEAALRERAGRMAFMGGRLEQARAAYERALGIHDQAGDVHAAARVSARLGEAEQLSGQLEHALERMERSFSVLATEEPDPDVADLAAMLARLHFFEGDFARASEQVEVALEMAEALRQPEVLSQALNTKSMLLHSSGRPEESIALIRHALEIALEHDLAAAALRAYFNLSYLNTMRERWDEGKENLERGLALARTRGERGAEWRALANLIDTHQYSGEWDLALARIAEYPDEALEVPQVSLNIMNPQTRILTSRGDVATARKLVDEPRQSWVDATTVDQQMRASFLLAEAVVRRAEGRDEEALAAAEESVPLQQAQSNAMGIMEATVEGVEAALHLGRRDDAQRLLALGEALAPGEDSQSLQAQRRRLGARMAAEGGQHDRAEQDFKRAVGAFRELAVPFWLAVTLLEYGEWMATMGRAGEAGPLFAEAREIFERLDARPWLERCDAAAGREAAVA